MNPRALPQQTHSLSDSTTLPVDTGSGWYSKVGSTALLSCDGSSRTHSLLSRRAYRSLTPRALRRAVPLPLAFAVGGRVPPRRQGLGKPVDLRPRSLLGDGHAEAVRQVRVPA